jgi:capsular polysaccharide transport system permease protein
MTTKPRAKKYRIRRSVPLTEGMAVPETGRAAAQPVPDAVNTPQSPTRRKSNAAFLGEAVSGMVLGQGNRPSAAAPTAEQVSPAQATPPAQVDSAGFAQAEQAIDALRQEGLTGRQLRMARRVAQKHGLAVTSDFDAVRQLRARGIDPFQRSNVLELVVPGGDQVPQTAEGRVQLPQTVPTAPRNLPSTERANPADRRAGEIAKIQRDLARRRRRKSLLLLARLSIFVMLPTLMAGWYFYVMATPMYATKSEFVIQQSEAGGGGGGAGLGGLFAGTSMATQQDSITVQSYLTSRAAMARLDAEHGFKATFSDPDIDPIQRLPEDATNETAYGVYQDHVRISYDPTEGILKMEVIAPDPATSQLFSEALIGYAEEQVDQLTQRLREDQMAGARASYEEAEERRSQALAAWLAIQEEVQQIDPIGETAARTQQISALETQRQQLQLELQTRLSVSRPNEAQVNSLRSQIANIEGLIANLRAEMTEATTNGTSLAAKNQELRLAEENYTFQTVIVQQALQQMEAARIEANRQVRYLSLGVEPLAPDQATYPRAFENTVLAFLIMAGIYLMLSITASILREQVTS